jgi:hypothetical protein
MTGYWWGVKRFLSLFWVVYICLKDKCISHVLPAVKSISPLKGLKPASLKILSPLFASFQPSAVSFQLRLMSGKR